MREGVRKEGRVGLMRKGGEKEAGRECAERVCRE